MNGNITIQKSAFVRLLDSAYPDPDGPEPHGPGVPIIYPGWLLSPQPEPWRSAVLARSVIDRAVDQAQLGEAIGDREKVLAVVRSNIRSFIDDYCGTVPHKHWPHGPSGGPPKPVDLLVAGAQFEKAAAALADHPLRGDLSAGADRLFETGLNRLER